MEEKMNDRRFQWTLAVLLIIANAIVTVLIARNICLPAQPPIPAKVDALGWKPKPVWI
jgi:hypothetical protein